MKIYIIGKKRADFVSKKGNAVKGTFIHYTFDGSEGFEGKQCGNLLVTDSVCDYKNIVLGGSYNLYFNQNGFVDSLVAEK